MMFQQQEFFPVSLAEEAILLYALDKELVDKLEEKGKQKFFKEIYQYVEINDKKLIDDIEEKLEMTPEIEKGIDTAIKRYMEENSAELNEMQSDSEDNAEEA